MILKKIVRPGWSMPRPREEFLDFHRAVTTGSDPASSILEGYRDLEVIANAIEASKLEQPFTI